MKKEIQPHKILVKIVVTFTQEMTEHFDISLSWKSRTIIQKVNRKVIPLLFAVSAKSCMNLESWAV